MSKKKILNKKINLKKKSLILFAPGVHIGGGLVLIKDIIENLDHSNIFLDSRLKIKINYKNNYKEKIFQTVLGRLVAELKLFKIFSKNKNKTLLCFHGLPPFFIGKNEKIVVFSQNSLHFEKIDYFKYSFKTSIKLLIEKLIFNFLMYKVGTFIVQTPYMKKLLVKKLSSIKKNKLPQVKILPFMPKKKYFKSFENNKIWDFIYVASGLPHKNHTILIDAWVELAKRNIRPVLALTLSKNFKQIIDYINVKKKIYKIKVKNLGQISRDKLDKEYQKSKTLIYPSLTESFGLPLLEATSHNLPILASELDYVRDVCNPIGTFDPNSILSVANAVEKYLKGNSNSSKINKNNLKIFSNEEFIKKILSLN